MNNEAIDILSFFQVRRSSDDRLWLYREADIMNNDIYFPFYANQSNSFDNRKSFLITHNQQVDPIIEIIFTHKSQEN